MQQFKAIKEPCFYLKPNPVFVALVLKAHNYQWHD